MNKFKFELGERVKDVVTGFVGVIMSRAEFLTGCAQYGVTSTKLDKDGKRHEWEYFDENRLVLFGKGIKLPTDKESKEKPVKGFDGNYPSKF